MNFYSVCEVSWYVSLGKELEHIISSMAPLSVYAGVPITVYLTKNLERTGIFVFVPKMSQNKRSSESKHAKPLIHLIGA